MDKIPNDQIIANQIRTPDGTILKSHHVHDFNCYTDENGNEYCVDGGTYYLSRSFDENDYEEISIFGNAPFEEIRKNFTWGTRGKEGNKKLKFVLLKNMETSHIKNILKDGYAKGYIKVIMQQELNYRKNNNINE